MNALSAGIILAAFFGPFLGLVPFVLTGLRKPSQQRKGRERGRHVASLSRLGKGASK